MANVFIKGVSGGENTNPDGTDALPIDDGTNSEWVKINNLFNGAPSQGDVVYFNGTKWGRLAAGTTRKLLQTLGTSNNPQWAYAGAYPCDFRLTLTTAVPVTTADVTGATNVFITPYKGNRMAVYDGSSGWDVLASAQLTVALGTLTSGLPYDIFVYNNAGVLAARSPVAWTNGTTRATALTTQDGVLVKTGATTDRYLGTFYTASTTATEDSASKRYLFNYYNRVHRFLNAKDTTNSWTYTTATWREANGSTAVGVGRVDIMIGWSEDIVKARYVVPSSTSANTSAAAGIGIDSTTANSAQTYGEVTNASTVFTAEYMGYPGVGFHFIQSLEIAEASGTRTWYGDNNLSYVQSGLLAEALM